MRTLALLDQLQVIELTKSLMLILVCPTADNDDRL